jgi:stage II sporulation protein M
MQSSQLYSVFARNKFLIAVIALAFISVMIVATAVTYVILLISPTMVADLQNLMSSTQSYVAMPPPYTGDLYRLIFFNNIGHFWNPIRVWVWIPFIGAIDLGYELLLNAIIIGGVASFVSFTRGTLYTVAGLLPHGIIEIPAFILEFAGLARWHITTTRAIYTKLSGRKVDRPVLKEEIKEAVILSSISVALFAIAAYIEAFITPHFLGLK